MFNLRRYLSLASAVALVAVTVIQVVLHNRYSIDELVELVESENVTLARAFANTIWPRFSSYVMSIPGADRGPHGGPDGGVLRARPETRKIHDTLMTLTSGLPVLKVKIYDLHGLTVYSSQPSQIGADRSDNPGYLTSARDGSPASKLSHRDTFSAFSGPVQDRDLVETYIPIRGPDGAIEGVFELYTDVTPLIAKIERGTIGLAISLLVILGLLYGALFLIVRHADRILKKQYLGLLRSEESIKAKNKALEIEVTDRKRAEAERRESRDLLQGVIDGMPAIVNVKGRDGRFVIANPAQAAFYGLTPDELVGRTPDDIVDSDYARMTRQVDLDVMETGLPTQSFEDSGVDSEGVESTWLTTKAPIGTANGAVTGVLTVSVDMTRMKHAEAALLQQSQSAELLRKIAAAANEAPDVNTAMRDCLTYICHYTWWPVGHAYEFAADGTGELVSTNLWHLDESERFDAFRRVTETSRFAAGRGLPGRVLASGKPAWVADISKDANFPRARMAEDIGVVAGMAFPVLIGRRVVAVLEFFSDVAAQPDEHLLEIMAHAGTQLGRAMERRRAEHALRESEAQFRDLIAGSIQGVLIHCDDKPLFANQALAEIFGYDCPDEILALPSVGELKVEHERKRLEAYSAARLRYGSAPERYEYEGVRKDGDPIWLENFVTVVAWNGEPAVLTTTVNITDRKRVEEALACSLEGLKIARDEARAANLAKSEFLATMSHELRTPLNAIIGFSEIIKDETFGPIGNAQYRGYASDIHGSGQHLLGLINNILDLSKVESGVEEFHEKDVHVPDLTHSVLRLVRQHAEKNGIELELDLGDDLPLLRGDERKLKQILINLLTNAVKFTDPGGKVTIKTWCRADSGFVFQVIDTGIGIAPEDIPKAFAQFGQIDSKRNRTQEGTGLGLPLSRSLAELHGGSLDLQSRPGVGTTVTVRLPAARIVASPDNSDSLDVEDSSSGVLPERTSSIICRRISSG